MGYNKSNKMWVFTPLAVYHDVFNHVKSRFTNRGIDVIAIPDFVFATITNTVPFSIKAKDVATHEYDYSIDDYERPRIT